MCDATRVQPSMLGHEIFMDGPRIELYGEIGKSLEIDFVDECL